MRKPTIKPTINRLNKQLRKLHEAGVYTLAELIDQRGFWSRMHKAKPRGAQRR